MCGIAGYGLAKSTDNALILQRMALALARRGPDGVGYWTDASTPSESSAISHDCVHKVGLTHRLYAVMNAPEKSSQPLCRDGYVMVYNGELYNYRDLAHGLGLSSDVTDTEVVLESYKRFGAHCFEQFAGFFAVVIYDIQRNRFVLARDHLGKAPLYYMHEGGDFYFGSTPEAILAARPDIRHNISEERVATYLQAGSQACGTICFWDKINSIDAGSYAFFELDGGFTTTCYYRYESQPSRHFLFDEAKTSFLSLLTKSLQRRMEGHLRPALCLSGGVDSAALAAIYAHRIDGPKLSAYTMHLPGVNDHEVVLAKAVAQRYSDRLEHVILTQTTTDVMTDDASFWDVMEGPFHDPALYIDHLQQQAIKATGTGVTINGGGADELLAGYPVFLKWALRASLEQGQYGHAATHAYSIVKNSSWAMLTDRIFDRTSHQAPYLYKPIEQPLHTSQNASMLIASKMTQGPLHYWLRSSNQHYMNIPMEPRMPFLDVDFVKFCSTLPTEFLLHRGWTKYLLRTSVSDWLPKSVVWNRVKAGFPFDTKKWLSRNNIWIISILQNTDNPYINTKMVVRDYDRLNQIDHGFLWRLVCFSIWWQRRVMKLKIR